MQHRIKTISISVICHVMDFSEFAIVACVALLTAQRLTRVQPLHWMLCRALLILWHRKLALKSTMKPLEGCKGYASHRGIGAWVCASSCGRALSDITALWQLRLDYYYFSYEIKKRNLLLYKMLAHEKALMEGIIKLFSFYGNFHATDVKAIVHVNEYR